MADQPTFQSNPYSSFDPSQWLNPYSLYNKQALPWPSQYSGTPTDAMGRPIQAPIGTTINSAPAAAAPAAAAPAPASDSPLIASMIRNIGNQPPVNTSQMAGGAQGGQGAFLQDLLSQNSGQGMNSQAAMAARIAANANPTSELQPAAYGIASGSQTPAAAASPSAAAGGAAPMDYNTVLGLLSNPGKVVTPGATVPASQSGYQPNNNVLQQFLANWQPAKSGPGSGFQQGFANALTRGK